jgi:Oligosaccaryltransferase
MEYELYQFLNYLGAVVVVLIIVYHFIGVEDDKSEDKTQVKVS